MAKLAVLAFLIACSGKTSGPTSKPTPTTPDDPTCPVAVKGTSVTAEDTSTGAALVFVTTSDVAELRKRVAAMAVAHNDHHSKMGPLPTGTEQGGGGHDHHAHHGGGMPAADPNETPSSSMVGVHSKAAAEDIEGGSKLAYIAFPDGVAKIQSELRMHAQHLASGTCKMDH